MKKSSKILLAGIAFPAGIAAGIALAADWARVPRPDATADATPAAATTESSGRAAYAVREARAAAAPQERLPFSPDSPRYTPIVEASRQVAPSVVSLTVLKTVRRSARRDLFSEFFGRSPGRNQLARTYGSGFAIDGDGYLLTNDHVVSGADSILVTTSNGRRLPARLVGGDALLDIAVLKVEAGVIPPAPLGTSSDLVVGEPAIAIGNPLGQFVANAEATVTTGVISGVGRDMRGEASEGSTLFADMIQTDASINPGNSGGALVNAEGRVIGVNSSIYSRSGGSEGIGFAIPIDRALRIATELKEFGRIRRPWIGVDPEMVASDTSLFYTMRVRRVAEGSPAFGAGLRPGDVLVRIDGRPIDSPLDFEVGLLDAGVGASVPIVYARDGRERAIELSVIERPSEQAERVEVLRGLQLVTVDERISVERALPVNRGALIVDISDVAAYHSRLRSGDVIIGIMGRQVETVEDAEELFRTFAGGPRISVSVVRDGRLVNTIFPIS